MDLDDIPASAFAVIRDFMYTGKGCKKMEDVSGVLLGADFLGIEQLFQATLHHLIYNPFCKEAIDICDNFNNIPADVKNYVMNFQALWEQERKDPAARAALDAVAAEKLILNYAKAKERALHRQKMSGFRIDVIQQQGGSEMH